MNTQSTIEKMSEHFKEMKDASPERVTELTEALDILLTKSEARYKINSIDENNIILAKQLNLI